MIRTRPHRAARVAIAALFAAMLPLLSGCPGDGGQPATRPAGELAGGKRDVQIVPRDAQGHLIHVFHLDVHKTSVPRGTVSRNEDFWKRVDEQRVDPATYDLLLKNGLRVGIAPTGEWEYFRQILEAHKADTRSGTATAGGAGSVTLQMKNGIAEQTVNYLNDRNLLVGRTYFKSDNLLGISFWPEPRRPDEMRMAISPTVRSTRTRLVFRRNGEEDEIVEVKPEFLYDLNLRVNIPSGHFLVVAPSGEYGRWPTSLGSTFFVTDGGAEQKETVLIFVPKLAPPIARAE